MNEYSLAKDQDLYMPKGKGLPVVTITGKGNKKRRCPLWDNTRKELSIVRMRQYN